MYRKLLLGLMLSAIFAVTASAQSGSRGTNGSSSRSNSSAANAAAYEKKLEHEADRQHLKMAKQIAKEDFAPIKLTKPQLITLKQAVAVNYQTMTEIDNSMVAYIPADKRKALKKSYKKSLREGLNEMEAMRASMQTVGISDASQEKVLELSKSKMEILDTVKSSVTSTLSEEQAKTLAAATSKTTNSKKMTDDKMLDNQGSTSSGEMMKNDKASDNQGSTTKDEMLKDNNS